MSKLTFKYHNLRKYLNKHDKIAIAFSGGTDSFLLAYVAKQVFNPQNILLVFLNHDFSPSYLKNETLRRLQFLALPFYVIDISLFHFPEITRNTINRCYICKKICFEYLKKIAFCKGFHFICDGTNKTDLVFDERPGIRALKELNVKSPFCETDFYKEDILELYKVLGIQRFILPPNSCLATRVNIGIKLDKQLLFKIDKAESFLVKRGFKYVRVRTDGIQAKIQVAPWQVSLLIDIKKEIDNSFKAIGFKKINIDKGGYKPIGLSYERTTSATA